MITNSDWIVLNAITYKIQSIPDLDEMRMTLMTGLGHLIDYDAASFYIVSTNDKNELCSPIGINYSTEGMLDYIHKYKKVDYSEGLMSAGKNIAYRESDLIPEEVRINTDYYKKVYNVQGWHYSLHLNISYNEHFLGVLSFFRNKGRENFSQEHVFILDMIKDHLAYRLEQDYIHRQSRRLTLSQCIADYGLSKKEAQVLGQLIHDSSSDEIAENLNISVSTLRKHCNHIYSKLGISQRIQLYDLIES